MMEFGGFTISTYVECPYNSIMLSCRCYTEDPDTGEHGKACYRWYVEDGQCKVEGDNNVENEGDPPVTVYA